MSEIGSKTVRTEQYEFEARTSDPPNAEPGEYWIRTDQTSSNPDVIAELRRQDTSGVSKIPLFADSEESNLGSKMARGPSVVLDDGTIGFVAMSTDSSAKFGSPRAVNASGTEYLSHNSLILATIPDSVDHLYKAEDDSDTTVAIDSAGSIDANINSSASPVYTTDSKVGNLAIECLDGDTIISQSGVDLVANGTSGEGSLVGWVKPTAVSDNDAFISWGSDSNNYLAVSVTEDANNNPIYGIAVRVNGTVELLSTSIGISTNTYQHISLVSDTTEAILDVGGTTETLTHNLDITQIGTGTLVVNKWIGFSGSEPAGIYDEFGVSYKKLVSSERQELRNRA